MHIARAMTLAEDVHVVAGNPLADAPPPGSTGLAIPFPVRRVPRNESEMNKEGQRLLDSVSESYGTEPPETFVDAPAPGWKTIVLATYYTLVVCLGGVQFGVMAVFSSPLLDDFHQTHVPTNFTVWSGFNQCVYQYLIAPIGPAGAVFGSILSSPVVAVTGFVTGLVVMSSLFVSGWLLMAASHFTYHGGTWSVVWFRTLLLLGRLLTGVGAGWAAGVVPVGASHVTTRQTRYTGVCIC